MDLEYARKPLEIDRFISCILWKICMQISHNIISKESMVTN